MPYVRLSINSGDNRVDQLIREIIEPYLEEVHWLLAATRPADGPDGHFPRACAAMLLATIAATSALPTYQRDGRKRNSDKHDFIDCVSKYFPWESIHVADDQYRSEIEKIKAAALALYEDFRCPLLHSGGLVGGMDTACRIIKSHPGHKDIVVSERNSELIAGHSTLNKQHVIDLSFRRYTIHVDYLYWCVRKMVERFAADPANTKRIVEHSSRQE